MFSYIYVSLNGFHKCWFECLHKYWRMLEDIFLNVGINGGLNVGIDAGVHVSLDFGIDVGVDVGLNVGGMLA